MKYSLRVLLSCLTLTFLTVGSAFATSYTYKTLDIDLSGYTLFNVSGINNDKQIVGTLWGPEEKNGWPFGFVMSGTTVQLPFPNNPSSANGISNNGAIVGGYQAYYDYGYIYKNGIYYTVSADLPGNMYGINNNGDIVGSSAASRGFYIPGHTVTLSSDENGNIATYPAVIYLDLPGAQRDSAFGINDNGSIAGGYIGGDGKIMGYLLKKDGTNTTLTTFSAPSFSSQGYTDTTAYGINNHDDVVGHFIDRGDATFPIYGFVRHSDGSIDIIQAFGSNNTQVTGINDDGLILGTYMDGNSYLHAFIASPVPLPSSLILLGSSLLGLIGWRKFRKG